MAEDTVNASQPTETAVEDPTRERLAIFEAAVEKLRRSEWTVAAFGAWLEEIAAQMAERQLQLQEIYSSLPPELEEVFLEEAEIGFRGITLYQAGIDRMREFVRSEEQALLEQALDSMRAGNGLILEAMRLNRMQREAEETVSSPFDEDVEDDGAL